MILLPWKLNCDLELKSLCIVFSESVDTTMTRSLVIVIFLISSGVFCNKQILSDDASPSRSCESNEDCQDPQSEQHFICHDKQCYLLRRIQESCLIDQQCPEHSSCNQEKCQCLNGFEIHANNTFCTETEQHRHEQQVKENKKVYWTLFGVTGGLIVLGLLVFAIVRHRRKKTRVRLNIQDRRKSVMDQSRLQSVSIPMAPIGPKRKFSLYPTERF